jgi:glycosyltransferase involved in cell wall biosynthesis
VILTGLHDKFDMAKRTLILTLPPMTVGGVSAKARLLAQELTAAGHDVSMAYYRVPGSSHQTESVFGDFRCTEITSRAPWLEQSYTASSTQWRDAIAGHDRHIAVGGTVLIAHPLACMGVRHFVWCAADLAGDRGFRRDAMSAWRRCIDASFVAPALIRQQDAVLSANNKIYGVSRDTVRRLVALSPARAEDIDCLPIPVDADFFRPDEDKIKKMRIGFAGRLDDPRKNAPLLFAALGAVRKRGCNATLVVTGVPTPELLALAELSNVKDHIEFAGVLKREELRDFYQSLSIFIITSFQEGLAIAGLEAMACGVPVVSTDCGGPADYVVDGETGYLTSFDVDAMADGVIRILNQPELSARMRKSARQLINSEFAMAQFRPQLSQVWQETWSEAL